MKAPIFILSVLLVLAIVGCGETSDPKMIKVSTDPSELYKNSQTLPVTYNTKAPEGFLPWPHQNPEYSLVEYEKMIDDLIFWSNFANWQGGEHIYESYLHSGLDVILPNGTTIYAVDAGIVREVETNASFGYQHILIEDKDDPNWGWSYVHTAHFYVNEGDEVEQGQAIGVVEFLRGYYEHIHLNRVRPNPTNASNSDPSVRWTEPLEKVSGERFFYRPDNIPPVFQYEILFMENGSKTIIAKGEQSQLMGDIDFAVAIRDDSLTSRYRRLNSPSHITPRKIEYIISNDLGEVVKSGLIDFNQLVLAGNKIDRNALSWQVNSLYLHPYDLETNGWRYGGWSYYVLTHFREHSAWDNNYNYLVKDVDEHYWDTDKLDENNAPVFPNGQYHIKVSAEDFSGNYDEFTTTVSVNN